MSIRDNNGGGKLQTSCFYTALVIPRQIPSKIIDNNLFAFILFVFAVPVELESLRIIDRLTRWIIVLCSNRQHRFGLGFRSLIDN